MSPRELFHLIILVDSTAQEEALLATHAHNRYHAAQSMASAAQAMLTV